MPKRSRKPVKRDPVQIARSVVDQVTGHSQAEPERKKDPAAVALGRKGGLKGGKARAAKLTKAQLSASAKKAARARWAQPRASVSQDATPNP
jgi:hypothetical protein